MCASPLQMTASSEQTTQDAGHDGADEEEEEEPRWALMTGSISISKMPTKRHTNERALRRLASSADTKPQAAVSLLGSLTGHGALRAGVTWRRGSISPAGLEPDTSAPPSAHLLGPLIRRFRFLNGQHNGLIFSSAPIQPHQELKSIKCVHR